MKNLIAVLAFIMMAQANAQAPGSLAQVVTPQPQAPIISQAQAPAPKKTLIYDERTNQLVEVAPQVQVAQVQQQPAAPVQAEATATAPSNQPIYILNNQRLQGYQGAVQDAPTTVVQDAPARVSVSETIRKERHGAEVATEDGIVMTLEKARLEDEVRRREKFNNALNSTTTAGTASATTQGPTAAAVAAPTPVIATAPAAAAAASAEETEVVEIPQRPQKKARKKVILEDESASNVDVKAEVRAALAEQAAAPLNLTSYYISGQVGTANYNDGVNIRGKLASGFSLGMVTPDRFIVEGSFMYGQFQVDDFYGQRPTYSTLDMDQYNWSVGGKYQLLPGKLRPTVGALASYTRRSYAFAGYPNGDSILQTDSFDAGLQAGVDLAFTNNFSIGADLRYLWNIASKNNSSNNTRNGVYYPGNGNAGYSSNNGGFKVVEDFSYYIATLAAKFTF